MFKSGMYIKCKLQNNTGKTLEVAVCVESDNGTEAVVMGYERDKSNRLICRRFKTSTVSASRVHLKVGISVNIEEETGIIVSKSRRITPDGLYTYWCKVGNMYHLISEDKLQAAFSDYEYAPEELFIRRGEEELSDYLLRNDIEDFISKANAITDGYEEAMNKKIQMYEHQIDTVQQVLANRPYRAILADEVGLGKTIEALVVLNYLIKKSVCKNAIVIVPDQLLFQWSTEAKTKFGLDVAVFSYSSYAKKTKVFPVLIVGFDDYIRYFDDFFVDKKCELMIIDEVHKSLHNQRLYSCLLKHSRRIKNKLLLSATPIMERSEEYYKLLKLLYPGIYSSIKPEQFEEILQKKKIIESSVAEMVSDIRYAFDDDILYEYANRIKIIGDEIKDYKLLKMMDDFSSLSYEEQRKRIKRALLYIQIAYEIENKFIRHRRSEILDESSKRILSKEIGYYLKGEDKLSKENTLYKCLTDEVRQVCQSDVVKMEDVVNIINSFFSSASALNSELSKSDLDSVFVESSKLARIESENERRNSSNSRIEELICYLKNVRKENKAVIFSDYYESAKLVYTRMCKEFGKDNVAFFTRNETEEKMDIAANTFKRKSDARFLVCDKYGAEGRNFQFADIIVHFDLPWSPARLEQRIGRLDRIGRQSGKKVQNVVLYVRDTVEEDLFELHNSYLNIFNESLCGIEIIFDELWDAILSTVKERGLFGFSYVFDTINSLKEKCSQTLFEEMLDMESIQEDISTNSIKDIMDVFSEEEKIKFYTSVLKWHYDSGYGKFPPKYNNNQFYISSFIRDEVLKKRRKYSPNITKDFIATCDYNEAEEQDDIVLLSKDHEIVRATWDSLEKTVFGKCIAISSKSTQEEWVGFVLTWEVDFNEFDNLGKFWSKINYGIKNDYIFHTRLSIPIRIRGKKLMAEDIVSNLKEKINEMEAISNEKISEILDYADVELSLNNAILDSKTQFINYINNEIDYISLEKKIERLKDKQYVYGIIERDSTIIDKMIDIHEAVLKMLNNYEVNLKDIIFVRL